MAEGAGGHISQNEDKMKERTVAILQPSAAGVTAIRTSDDCKGYRIVTATLRAYGDNDILIPGASLLNGVGCMALVHERGYLHAT